MEQGVVGQREVDLSQIVVVEACQPRLKVDGDLVKYYAELMRVGAEFPPLVLYDVDGQLVLSDGRHRKLAAEKIGLAVFLCQIRSGTIKDAFRHALWANARHGLRYTVEDRFNAVTMMLKDPVDSCLPDTHISEICHVTRRTVMKMRRKLGADKLRRLTTRHGKPVPVNTGRIGEKKAGGTMPSTVDCRGVACVSTSAKGAFRDRVEMAGMIEAIGSVLQRIVKLARNKSGSAASHVDMDRMRRLCDEVRLVIRDALPHALCPFCVPTSASDECPACGGSGWVTKQGWDRKHEHDVRSLLPGQAVQGQVPRPKGGGATGA